MWLRWAQNVLKNVIVIVLDAEWFISMEEYYVHHAGTNKKEGDNMAQIIVHFIMEGKEFGKYERDFDDTLISPEEMKNKVMDYYQSLFNKFGVKIIDESV